MTLMQVSADTAQLQLRMRSPRSHEFVLKYLKFLTAVLKLCYLMTYSMHTCVLSIIKSLKWKYFLWIPSFY